MKKSLLVLTLIILSMPHVFAEAKIDYEIAPGNTGVLSSTSGGPSQKLTGKSSLSVADGTYSLKVIDKTTGALQCEMTALRLNTERNAKFNDCSIQIIEKKK